MTIDHGLTDEAAERHLLTHAAAMGGWLSQDYVVGFDDDAAGRLVNGGLAEWQHTGGTDPVGRWIFRLTVDGAEWAEASR